jgi:ATP/maltotriose-dependent transcriptional regulator MalT
MLDDMMGRAVSPVFVGRRAELDILTEAYEETRSRSAMAVLVGGEAGVGKSRLIGKFIEQAAAGGAHVLFGGCVELSTEGLAYAPFTAALRQLVRETGTEEISALLPDGAGRDLARLLPEFGEPNSDTETENARARLFEQLLTLLERLAERQPLVLAIEDIHWADRSSRDLIAFLSRNLRTAPVLMLLTFRSDELHRQHPLRPVLAELARVDGVIKLELPRLTHDEVAAQMAGILGSAPEYGLVSKVYERSEGIPLFVEALLEAGSECGFPESLHDLIIGSVERLPEDTQRVLRTAAAGGIRIGHGLLSAVSGLCDTDLEGALRPAIAGNVIQVADGHAYVFRHALIREAVHDELLPGEHTRLHARFAEEIERDRGLVPPGRAAIEIAHHWYSARDDLWALISAWKAAGKAAHAYAYTEQMQLLERVLTLWDKVPDAAERIGADHTTILELASEAAYASGEIDRGIKFVKGALAGLDEQREPERVAELIVRLSQLQLQRLRPGVLENLRHAEKLVPEPGAARAHVLAKLGSFLMFSGETAEGTLLTQEALRMATSLGDEGEEAELLINLAIGQSIDGRLAESIATNERAREIGHRLGSGRLVLRALGNNIDALTNLGRSEEAVALAIEGERLAKKYGTYRMQGTFIANNRAEALECLGRWDEALEVVDTVLRRDPVLKTRYHLLRVRANIAVGRGDLGRLESALSEMHAFAGLPLKSAQDSSANARLLIHWYQMHGEPHQALAVAERALRDNHSSKAMLGWRLLSHMFALCEATSTTAATADLSSSLRAQIAEVAAKLTIDGPVAEAYRLLCVGDFDAAATAWDRLGRPYPRAKALLAAAEAAAGANDRDGAAVRLRQAHPVALSLGAVPLAGEIEALARRIRVSVTGEPEPGPAPGSPLLTPRELEVLRLVAKGRSNRDIAAELFISAKTVSVHVSNILGKLGVASRTEATAAAHRLSLLAGRG